MPAVFVRYAARCNCSKENIAKFVQLVSSLVITQRVDGFSIDVNNYGYILGDEGMKYCCKDNNNSNNNINFCLIYFSCLIITVESMYFNFVLY